MTLIQLLLIAFVIFVLVGLIRRFRRGDIRQRSLVVWGVLWILIIAAVSMPQTTEILARILGVGRGVDAALYLSIVLLFYLQFKMFSRMEKMERTITAAIRAAALREFEKEKKV